MAWTPYELHHTNISLLSEAGADKRRISDMAEHRTTRMIDGTYRHALIPEAPVCRDRTVPWRAVSRPGRGVGASLAKVDDGATQRELVFRPEVTGVTIWAPLIGVMGTVLAIVFTVLGVSNAFAPLFIPAAFGALFMTLGIVYTLRILRPVQVGVGNVVLPAVIVDNRGYRRRREIPLARIGGVGLAFRKMLFSRSGGPAWFLTFWVDGEPPVSCLIASEPKKSFYRGAEKANPYGHPYLMDRTFDPLPFTDVPGLGGSGAADVARAVHARIAEVQGGEGPLTTQALQKHPNHEWGNGFPIYAWWSPDDGSVGSPIG